MIRVNLLPPDKRKLEQIPPKVFAVLIAGIALTLGGIVFAVFQFMEYSSLDKDLQDTNAEIAKLEEKKAKAEQLDSEKNRLKGQISDIESVTGVRGVIDWTTVMYTILQLAASIQDRGTPMVWIEEIKSQKPSTLLPAAAATKLPNLVVKCGVRKQNNAAVREFRKALRQNAVIKKYFPTLNDRWKIDEKSDDKLEDKGYWVVDVTISPP